MMEEPEENRLDHSLRDKFEDFDLPPSARVWPAIAQRLAAPAPGPRGRRPVPLPLLVGLVALLSGLAGWLLPHQTAVPRSAPATATAIAPGPFSGTRAGPKTANPVPALVKSGTAATKSTPAMIIAALKGKNSAATRTNAAPLITNLSSPVAKAQAIRTNSGRTVAKPGRAVTNLGANTTKPSPKVPIGAAALAAPSATRPALPAVAPARALLPDSSFTAADSLPATLRALAVLERQTLVQLPSIATLTPGPPTADRRTALVANLRTERAELFRLQRRTDSLLLALGDLPGAPLAASAGAAPDTARPHPLAHRWSLLLTATPEQNALALQGPETDTLTALRRNHETGRTGFSAALQAEYALTPRLSVGGGVGYSTFGANLNITNKSTEVRVAYDTTTTTTTNVYTSTNQTHSIRIIQVPQLSPIFNGNGQVIRYDTVYVPRQDTVFTTIVQHDTVHTARKVITPLISKHETLTTKHLQPTYHFFTVPVLLRYRLSLGPGRWWADVAAGAQLQFFLGGTQVVTSDGENFRTETITPGNGPFRALNLALSGSLALNYALTNRLSLNVAPSLRWQALSVYKTETGLVQQPTATGLQLGMRFKL